MRNHERKVSLRGNDNKEQWCNVSYAEWERVYTGMLYKSMAGYIALLLTNQIS